MERLARLAGVDPELLADRNFQVLLLGSVTSPLGAAVVSPILESLIVPYGASEASIGLVMSAFTAPAIVAIPLVGVLSDRVGRKPVLTAGLALFGLAGVAIPLTTDFRVVLLLRAVQGLSYTGIAPVLIASVGDLYAGEREAAAQGVRFTTVGLSLTAFPLLAGSLLAFGWRVPFGLYAVALPTALAVAVWFVEPTAAADEGPTPDAAPDGGDVPVAGQGVRSSIRQVAALVRRPAVAALLVGRAAPSFVWFVFITYNSIVVVRLLGGTASAAGAVVAAASLASAVGATQVGRVDAAFDGRRVPLVATMGLLGAGVVGLGLAPSVPAIGAAALCTGAGFGVGISLLRSTVTGVATADTRGGVVSLAESLGRVGSTVSPLVLGAAVALTRDVAGFETAVRTSIVAAALAGTLAGIGCVVVATRGGA